jgi:flagellar capping protein FliD
MSGISSSVGLFSGINFVDLVDQLIAIDRRPIALLEQRAQTLVAENTALKTLEANLLSLTTAGQQLDDSSLFEAFNVSNSSPTSLSVTSNDDVVEGGCPFCKTDAGADSRIW